MNLVLSSIQKQDTSIHFLGRLSVVILDFAHLSFFFFSNKPFDWQYFYIDKMSIIYIITDKVSKKHAKNNQSVQKNEKEVPKCQLK